ncbi:MAG: hypothetical protein J6V68_01350 [Clostridia bacterium]|nr:hypothetical protein [Clostridia bacterium]
MANKKTTKRAILASVIAMVLCLAMFVGTTYAWFTDSVTSTGNKIVAGTLKIDLAEKTSLDCVGDEYYQSIKDTQAAIFNYDNWEPGYMDVTALRISNEGSLALKWYAKFVSDYELSMLADVIQVYVNPSDSDFGITVRDEVVANWQHVGTVKDFVNTIETTTYGVLAAGEAKYLGIALVMDKEAGNEYQGLSLCGDFDILILATQVTAESDDFDDQYDVDSEFDSFVVRNVYNEEQLAEVLSDTTKTSPVVVNVKGTFDVTQTINVVGDITINLANSTMLTDSLNVTRPFNMMSDTSLVINNNANTQDIVVGKYGLINVAAGSTNVDVTLNGGSYVSNADNGAFIKLRDGNDLVDIVLNDVTYVDSSDDSYIIHSGEVVDSNPDAIINVTVVGGSYTSYYGFSVYGKGLAVFSKVEINTQGVSVCVGGASASVENCIITTGTALDGSAPAACVAVSGNARLAVSGSTLEGPVAYYVYSSGGIIDANDNDATACADEYEFAVDLNNYPKSVYEIYVNGSAYIPF